MIHIIMPFALEHPIIAPIISSKYSGVHLALSQAAFPMPYGMSRIRTAEKYRREV
jgi:hypothetical protein